MARLKLKDIYKSYNDTDVITGIDLDIAHGEFVVLSDLRDAASQRSCA